MFFSQAIQTRQEVSCKISKYRSLVKSQISYRIWFWVSVFILLVVLDLGGLQNVGSLNWRSSSEGKPASCVSVEEAGNNKLKHGEITRPKTLKTPFVFLEVCKLKSVGAESEHLG